ncbi:MAG: nucleoside hydrolase [Pseudorhodobacter sp.]
MKLIIDTDPGVDDAMAFAYAAAHPDIELIALTTVFGNIALETATRNALWLSDLSGSQVPVHAGAAGPLNGNEPHYVPHIHGEQGLGSAIAPEPKTPAKKEPAAEFLIRAAAENPGQVTLCAVGPLTNIARAMTLDPGFLGNLAQLVIMGGSLHAGGNVTPHAEANFHSDPEAANQVLHAPDAGRITIIGLDVTTRVIATPDQFRQVPAGPMASLLVQATDFYMEFHRQKGGHRICYMHDPAAVIYVIRPDLFGTAPHRLEVCLKGAERGAMRQSHTAPTPCQVAMTVESEAVSTEFFRALSA